MDSSKKLYVAVAVLGVLGGTMLLQNKAKKKDESSHSFAKKAAELPKLALTDESIKTIDHIELTRPAKVAGEKGADGVEATESKPAESVVLAKVDESRWDLTSPLTALATFSNVKSLLENAKGIKVTDAISTSKDNYDRWGVSDSKALHVVLKKGSEAVLDVYLGEDGSRGQSARFANIDGVFSVKGLSKFHYSRDLKDWRDRAVLHFDESAVVKVTAQNEFGSFEFNKEAETWTSSLKPVKGPAKPIDKFKPAKVDDLVRAYKALNVVDFGDDKKPADVGLVTPHATLTFDLKEGKQHVVYVGDTADGTNRWATTNDHPVPFSIAAWSADWALGNAAKYQDAPAPTEAKTDAKGGTKLDKEPAKLPSGHPKLK